MRSSGGVTWCITRSTRTAAVVKSCWPRTWLSSSYVSSSSRARASSQLPSFERRTSERAGRKNAKMTPASVAWMPELYMHTHSTRPTSM